MVEVVFDALREHDRRDENWAFLKRGLVLPMCL